MSFKTNSRSIRLVSLPLSAILLVFAICAIGCTDEVPQKTTIPLISDEDSKTLRYLKEVEWPKAYREQDTVLLDRILGEDFQMIDNSGAWYSKRDELDWITNNGTSYDSFRYEIKRLDILDNGTAVVAGTGYILNDTTRSTYQSSNVLVKRESGWKAILSHVSGYKDLN